MNLENQVVSLELAERLKDLGVKQESLWWWELHNNSEPELRYIKGSKIIEQGNNYYCSAFTCAELGEMLPDSLECCSPQDKNKKYYTYLEMDKHSDQRYRGFRFRLRYRPKYNKAMANFHNNEFRANTEANARAKMLVYLLENKLITKEA